MKKRPHEISHVGIIPRDEVARQLKELAHGVRSGELRLRLHDQELQLLPRGQMLTKLTIERGICRGRLLLKLDWDESDPD